MCQGLLCAGDEEACGPQLRCPKYVTQYNMPTIPFRYYCYHDNDIKKIQNNGSYDLLDRSDEDLSIRVTRNQSINYKAVLTPCTDRDGDAGFECNGQCWHTAFWCNDKRDGFCDHSGVRRNDPRLCLEPTTFWQEINCKLT